MKRALVLLAVFSTAAAHADITGKWVGTMDVPKAMASASVGGKTVTAKSQGSPVYTLTLEKGGKYKMDTKNPNGKSLATSGTWKLNGSELTLSPSAESKKLSPNIQERKLKVGAGEKSLTLEIKVKMMNGPVKVAGGSGKLDPKKAEEIKKLMASAKDVTMVVQFKRP